MFRTIFLVSLVLSVASDLPGAGIIAESAIPRHAFGGIQPCLSPDGQQIALSYQGAIFRMPRTGGVLTRLTSGEGWDVDPAWSADGKRIAFLNSFNLFVGQLRVIEAVDGAPVALPVQVRGRGRVEFHPDGQRLLGRFSATGQPDSLTWYRLETGQLEPVPLDLQELAGKTPLQWTLAPDGSAILFTTSEDRPGEQDGNNGPQTRLWQVAAQGGRPQLLLQWPARIYNLRWTGKGDGCLLTTDRGGAFNDIWHVPLATPERAQRITHGDADEDGASTSRDQHWLVHTENSGGATALVCVDLGNGNRTLLAIDQIEWRVPTGTLHLRVLDGNTPAVARLSLKQKDGKFYAPQGALYRLTAGQGHFYGREQATLTLPAGTYEISASRGPEFKLYKAEITISSSLTQTQAITLDRWTHMAARGWYSGENHIHANYGYGAWHHSPKTILDLCEGEDLNIANLMVANSDGDGVFDRKYFLGRPDHNSGPQTVLYWNEEFRSTLWGHMTLVNLTRLVEPIFTGFKDTTNPWDIPTNADIAESTRRQQGSVSYTHPANNPDSPYDSAYSAKGVPVDAALGRIDTLDVMGFGYEASVRLWYRLLNCGLRIPAAAGTDCFLNRINGHPPGWGRAYVKLPDGFGYRAWVEGQRSGRSFITTGPMLEFTVDGQDPGTTKRLTGASTVRVVGQARSEIELESLELILNGRVIHQGQVAPDRRSADLDQRVPIETSGWIAIRTTSKQRTALGVPAVAHSNPVHLELPGHPFDAKNDAEFFLAWIDRLERDLKKRERIPTGLDYVQMQLNTARARYQKLIPSR